MIINGDIKFSNLGSGELQNAIMERLSTVARDLLSPVAGQLVYNTTTNLYNFYDGTQWNDFATGGNASTLAIEIDAIEAASGGIFATNGTFDGTTVDGSLGNVTGSTDLLNTLTQLDAAITAAGVDTFDELTDTNLTAITANDLLQWNGTDWVNVAPTTIGEFGFKTVSGDTGAAVADVLGDSLGLVGATNGGVTTVGEDTGDTVSFAITPVDLSASVATLEGSDFLMVSDSGDTATDAAKTTTITKLLSDLDIVTASADGVLVRTADDTYASRTLTASVVAGDQGISIVDGDGVAGNPTLGLDLVGLTAEVGTIGATDVFAIYDGTNNVKVTLAQLNSALIASGSALDDLTDVVITAANANDFIRYDGSNWVDTDVATVLSTLNVYTQTEADNNFVDVTGDTMSGILNMGSNAITSLATPTVGTDAANKSYVDALVAGLTWKNSAVAASTANIDLATGGVLTVDGVVTVAGDRVLVKDQTNSEENGVYIVAAGTWARSLDFDSVSPVDEINSAAIFVEAGTAGADTGWTVTSNVAVVDTDAILFTQFNGASGITAGAGLTKTGNTLDVQFGAGLTELPTDGVGIDLYADEALHLTTDGTDDSTASGSKLQLRMDGSTLTSAHAGLKVTAAGISEVELNASVAGDGLDGGAGTALSVTSVAASGLTITGGQLDLDLAGVPNDRLTNSVVTFAADTGSADAVALGETVTVSGGTGVATVVTANEVTVNLSAGIDLLTDVDTTTAGPSTDDVLVWDGSNWVPGNPVNSSAELTDVTAAATVAGQVLVSDGTDYTPRQIQYVDTQASSAVWTVAHGLNQKFVNVTVYDSSDSVIIPQSIVATDANTTTVTFNTAISGTAVIMGLNGLVAV